MERKVFFLGLIILLGLSGCRQEEKTAQNAVVRLESASLAGEKVLIEELLVHGKRPVDSVVVASDGAAVIPIPLEEAGFFLLSRSEKDVLLLQLDPGDTVLISCEGVFPGSCVVKGSEGSELIREFEKFMDYQRHRVDSLGQIYLDSRGAENFLQIKERLDSLYTLIVEDQRNYIDTFTQNHSGSLAGLIVLNRPLGQNQVVDDEQDYDWLYRIDTALQRRYPGNRHTVDHHNRVEEAHARIFDRISAEKKVMSGNKAPDIVLNDTTGNPWSLKKFTGHPVLIHFWAGWEARSRRDNLRLAKEARRLEKGGVRLVGVSIDNHPVIWKGAVKVDSLWWIQVNDPEMKVAKEYNIPENPPFYYLLDPDLRIAAKSWSLDSILVQTEKLFLQTDKQ